MVGERGARRSCYGLLAEAKSACTGSVVPLFYQQAAHRHSNHRIFTDWEAEAGGKPGASEVFRRFPSSQNGISEGAARGEGIPRRKPVITVLFAAPSQGRMDVVSSAAGQTGTRRPAHRCAGRLEGMPEEPRECRKTRRSRAQSPQGQDEATHAACYGHAGTRLRKRKPGAKSKLGDQRVPAAPRPPLTNSRTRTAGCPGSP